MDDNLIPIVGIICLFGLPMFGWILGRVYKHRERMEMLRRGMVPPRDDRAWRRAMRYQGGGAWQAPPWTQSGPQPMGAPMPPYVPVDDPDSAQCTLHGGIKTAMVGFALLIGLSFIGYHSGDGPFGVATIHPGPWLLGGLIPMFVGIAQIIIALLSGATLSMRAPQIAPPGPPPPPGQRAYGEPQPGQPGQRYEELARPVKPPDRL
jgi:hypothetical protein